MGTKITELMESKEITIQELRGKTFTVDAHNILYQFLSTIRQSDGRYLTDSKGQVTSHLLGLFSRMTRLMMNDMNFIYCFDGKVPDLKRGELDKRKETKQDAQRKYEEAKEKGDKKEMLKYAQRSARLTPEMINEAKKLIDALGQCWVQAPSEGEAQASHIVKKRDAYAVISQDADCFLFGCPRLVKNLTISNKRKLPGRQAYTTVNPEMISLSESLSKLGINQDQLIKLGVLVGTDFNPGGIKGIGPKTALKLVKENKPDMFEKWSFTPTPKQVINVFKNMETTDDYEISFGKPDKERVMELMVEKHDFDKERTEKTLIELEKSRNVRQTGLGQFF